ISMDDKGAALFTGEFLATLRSLIGLHHSLYPRIPPQGVFFESLVEQAFKRIGWPVDQVTLTTPNSPQHDLKVGTIKLSLKTETGTGTNPEQINITKLCTTETGEWESVSLIRHVLTHLARYDLLLMLRAIWRPSAVHYQLLDIPLELLGRMSSVTILPVGR